MTRSATELQPAREHAGVDSAGVRRGPGLIWYFALGCFFGVVLVKSEAVSWFRIQEMFRFQSFHLYGIIFSALVIASLSIVVLRRLGIHTLAGDAISIPSKMLGKGYRSLDRGHAVRHGLGAHRRVSRTVVRAHR